MENMEKATNFLPRVDEAAAHGVDRAVVTLTAPASHAAEQYRTLYYRLERLREMRPMKVLAFTSAMPGEGKTVTAVNLALTSARANPERRILLLDADLRRPQVAELLGTKGKPGLCELLNWDCELPEAVRRFKANRLAVIPGGKRAEEATGLLAGARMKQLLKALREAFDEIYVDLPPALPFADSSILTAQSDGVVLVIRANVTSQRRVQQAMEHLAGVPVVGCVLNGVQTSSTVYMKNYLK